MKSYFKASLLALVLPAMAHAQSDNAFVEANILGIFYHELGHAVIDLERVPIFGQEEDAADVFSIYLIHSLFEEEAAQSLAYDASFGFWGEAIVRQEARDEIAWWDDHGPDEQRYFNTACIFYGGNPDARAKLAEDLGLPDDRAENCPFEFDQADQSWGAVLDALYERGAGETMTFVGDADGLAAQLIQAEVRDLNAELSLSDSLSVAVESCGEANAFYDPQDRAIVFCREFVDHLIEIEARF